MRPNAAFVVVFVAVASGACKDVAVDDVPSFTADGSFEAPPRPTVSDAVPPAPPTGGAGGGGAAGSAGTTGGAGGMAGRGGPVDAGRPPDASVARDAGADGTGAACSLVAQDCTAPRTACYPTTMGRSMCAPVDELALEADIPCAQHTQCRRGLICADNVCRAICNVTANDCRAAGYRCEGLAREYFPAGVCLP